MGILDLRLDGSKPVMHIFDVLEGLEWEQRVHLVAALRQRDKLYRFTLNAMDICKACEDDGFIVSPVSIAEYRTRYLRRVAR